RPQTTENRRQKTEGRGQRAEDGQQNIGNRPERLDIPKELPKENKPQETICNLKSEIKDSQLLRLSSYSEIRNSNESPITQEQIFDKENNHNINIERHKEKDEFFSKDSKDYKDYKENKPSIFQSNILKEPILSEEAPETLNFSIENPKKQDFSLDKKLYEIVQRADLELKEARTEMNIILKPEFLGKLNMKLTMNEGILDTKFTVGNPHLKELIETNLNDLRETFSQLEVEVGNIEVSIENGFLTQRNLWDKIYNESQLTNQGFIFEPKESSQFHSNDDKLARLYWTQASFEFTA
ncbi:MAG: flagellar hook-length control protein FliK, partial [bacterium]